MQANPSSPDAVADSRQIRSFMQARGFQCCDARSDIDDLHALAAALIPVEIASADTIAAVQQRTGCSIYLRRENGNPTGFLGFFAFSAVGQQVVESGSFPGAQVRPEWVCAADAQTRLGYVWGFGGTSRGACFSVIRTGRLMRDHFFPHLGVYARAATPDGRKVMEPLGYRRASATDPGFYFSPPFSLTQLRTAS
jgi:hypothetical protein